MVILQYSCSNLRATEVLGEIQFSAGDLRVMIDMIADG